MKTRSYVLLAIATCLLTWLLSLTGCNSQNSSQSNSSQVPQISGSSSKLEVINIGHQNGTPGLNLLKARGLLEKRLAPQNIQVN
ncbi:hypothetical protein [Brasilonema sp. UFV-L1]|uniref:hypothetical protein n=1 Tax=Brasilonema sp. UFV-L1 TaxID=2234130 RepID=UPI00145E4DB2|nr:hypothetical protein [Brasilonema sp. UFV-L1]NMG11734.1 hypothetical protein [Brasilonema sp. UFV-L1]